MRNFRIIAAPVVLAAALSPDPAAAQTSKPAAAPASQPAAGGTAEKDMSEYRKETIPVAPKVTPQHITVQHILIGFEGSVPGKGITRTQEEAKKLAYEVLEMARKGADFDTLVAQWTNDSPPGIYSMSNKGVPPAEGEFPRDRMVPAFGDVGFAISPGNIDIADYDPKKSPYGWHIIKRVK